MTISQDKNLEDEKILKEKSNETKKHFQYLSKAFRRSKENIFFER